MICKRFIELIKYNNHQTKTIDIFSKNGKLTFFSKMTDKESDYENSNSSNNTVVYTHENKKLSKTTFLDKWLLKNNDMIILK